MGGRRLRKKWVGEFRGKQVSVEWGKKRGRKGNGYGKGVGKRGFRVSDGENLLRSGVNTERARLPADLSVGGGVLERPPSPPPV